MLESVKYIKNGYLVPLQKASGEGYEKRNVESIDRIIYGANLF